MKFFCSLVLVIFLGAGLNEACNKPGKYISKKNQCEARYISNIEKLQTSVGKDLCQNAKRITKTYTKCLKKALVEGKKCNASTKAEVEAMIHTKWWSYSEICTGQACQDEDLYYAGLVSCQDTYNETMQAQFAVQEVHSNYLELFCSAMSQSTKDLEQCWRDTITSANCSQLKHNDIDILTRLAWQNYEFTCEDCQNESAFQAAVAVCMGSLLDYRDSLPVDIASNPLLQLVYCHEAPEAVQSFGQCLSWASSAGGCTSGMSVLRDHLVNLAWNYYSAACASYEQCQSEMNQTRLDVTACMELNAANMPDLTVESSMSYLVSLVSCIITALHDKTCLMTLPSVASSSAYILQQAIGAFFAPLFSGMECETIPMAVETIGHCLLAVSGLIEDLTLNPADLNYCSTITTTLVATENCILGRLSEMKCDADLSVPAQTLIDSGKHNYNKLCGNDCEFDVVYEAIKESCVSQFGLFINLGSSVYCRLQGPMLMLGEACMRKAVFLGRCGDNKQMEAEALIQYSRNQLSALCSTFFDDCAHPELYEMMKEGCVYSLSAFANLGSPFYCSVGGPMIASTEKCLKQALFFGGCGTTKQIEAEQMIQAVWSQYYLTCNTDCTNLFLYETMKEGCITSFSSFTNLAGDSYCSLGQPSLLMSEACIAHALFVGDCGNTTKMEAAALTQAARMQYALRCSDSDTCLYSAVSRYQDIFGCYLTQAIELKMILVSAIQNGSLPATCLQLQTTLQTSQSCMMGIMVETGCAQHIPEFFILIAEKRVEALTATCAFTQLILDNVNDLIIGGLEGLQGLVDFRGISGDSILGSGIVDLEGSENMSDIGENFPLVQGAQVMETAASPDSVGMLLPSSAAIVGTLVVSNVIYSLFT